MAKVKHTKNELKAQREALRRYQRYLPTLLLKKQQLQMEVRQVEAKLEQSHAAEQQVLAEVRPWLGLLAEPFDLEAHLAVVAVREDTANVAGVTIPVLVEVVLQRATPDLLSTPPWVDDALSVLERLLKLRAERRILEEQRRRLAEELLVTSQRVNLFEKVKIPESRENIRVIRIFLGDAQTLEVARSKIAKGKALERETEA